MKLLIISHTPHFKTHGIIKGWGATIREIDQLAKIFEQVVHVAPLHKTPAPESSLPYTYKNIRLHPVKPAGGNDPWQKAGILLRTPDYFSAMKNEMKQADLVHVRCPASISLVALLARELWAGSKPCWVKYAGNWQPDGKETLSYTMQRWWLRDHLKNGVVTVNGSWPGQPPHVYPFRNPSFTQEEYCRAVEIAGTKEIQSPLKLLFVGRLERAKGIYRIIEIARLLHEQRIAFQLTMIGDGPERHSFEETIRQNGLNDQVSLTGWQSKNALASHYKDANIILLPSTASEGWPKVLSEAMAYGAVPLTSTISSIPQILADSGAGITLPADDIAGFARAIRFYLDYPQEWKKASLSGTRLAAAYTYEDYLDSLQKLFRNKYGLQF